MKRGRAAGGGDGDGDGEPKARAPRKCGVCKREGHTRKNCPSNLDERYARMRREEGDGED